METVISLNIPKHSMVVKTITVTEEAYEKMKGLKKNDESFSQLFIRIVNGQKVNITDFFGVLKLSDRELKDWREERERNKKREKELDEEKRHRLEKRIKEIGWE